MTDAELENRISAAGRDRVFAIVRAAGWAPADSIPRWVWEEAIRTAGQGRDARSQALLDKPLRVNSE